MGRKKILLVTGKFPGVSADMDGGSIMVSQIIEMFGDEAELDVLFTRSFNGEYCKINGVNKVYFNPCKYRDENKFSRRIKNVYWNSGMLSLLIPRYEKVIIIHCSKAFGLDVLPDEQISKVILFPMFLSSSYKLSGEVVPAEYTLLEKKVIAKLRTIITPTYIEKEDLIKNYNIDPDRVVVIPRAVSPCITNKVRSCSAHHNIIYIGSIKTQKNTEQSIELVRLLKAKGLDVHLNIVGGIQNMLTYERCEKLINDYDLGSQVSFLGVLHQSQLANVISCSDLNISVSLWETFGRGIIEGLAGGLPTVVLNGLVCLKRILPHDSGLLYADDVNTMASLIFRLCTDCDFYESQSRRTSVVSELFSVDSQKRLLAKLIYGDNYFLPPQLTNPYRDAKKR